MKEYILDTMLSGEKGLYICELPTGYGKTYNVVRAMRDYVVETNNDRKILYLTTLNKNLPEDELLSAFGNDEAAYHRYVLRIRSNFDEVTEKIEKLSVPDEFRTNTYESLVDLVRLYNQAVKKKIRDPEYVRNLEERLNETERNFRREITVLLKKRYSNKQERLQAIRTDCNLKWIGELYPAVFTDEHQILLMSISKFMKRNSCLVEPSYEFLKADMLENAIIFIDEFDATKATIQDVITEQALAVREEYLSLFRQILRGLNPRYLSRAMTNAYRHMNGPISGGYTFESILQEAQSIEEKYAIYLSYKTAEDTVDRKQNFLLKDATYHTLFHNDKDYIRAAKNDEENRVDIFFETREEFYANKAKNEEKNIVVFALLREINRFLAHFRIFLFAWARHYMQEINGHRNPEEDEMTMENAISSILGKFELSYAGQQIILNEIRGASVQSEKKGFLPDNSFYQQGMEIFELEDHDAHYDTTRLRLVAVSDTPEKILTYLSEKASVIGVSATAEIPSVVGNYDLAYLKKKLGELFHTTPEEKKNQICEELSKSWSAYRDGRIKIHTEVVKNQSVNFDAQEVCEKIFSEEEYAMVCAKLIQNTIDESYYEQRYCNILYAMHCFCENPIGSMLYLGMALPKKNNPQLDEELLRKMLELVLQDCRNKPSMNVPESMTAENNLVILRSNHFDEDKEILINRLGNGEKIFIISSYQNPERTDYAEQLADSLRMGPVVMTKGDMKKLMNMRTKAGKHFNRFLHEHYDIWISPEIKDSKFSEEFMLENVTDIRYFEDFNTDGEGIYSLNYYAGPSKESLKFSVNNASIIRQVQAEDEVEFKELLPLMAVDFVRIGQFTVLPFPFKYLREYKKFI